MVAQGSIVNIVHGSDPAHAWTAASTASKGGVLALTCELAISAAARAARTRSAPAEDAIHQALPVPPGADAKLIHGSSFDGFGEPADAASAIAFSPPTSALVNGTMLRWTAAW
jgi:hypothetical protein